MGSKTLKFFKGYWSIDKIKNAEKIIGLRKWKKKGFISRIKILKIISRIKIKSK